MNDTYSRPERLYRQAYAVRRRVARMTERDGFTVQSNLSSVDLVVSLCGGLCLDAGGASSGSNGSYVLLAKGHATYALAATLAECGWPSGWSPHDCKELTSDRCWHPGLEIPGVELKSGTLCELLAVGIELTQDARRRGSNAKAFVVASGAQLDSTELWDSVRFMAAQDRQGVVLVIENQSLALALGSPFTRRFDAFGWDVLWVDGHSLEELHEGLHESDNDRPRLVIADTVCEMCQQVTQLESPGWAGGTGYIGQSERATQS